MKVTRREGVEKSEIFADVIDGSPLVCKLMAFEMQKSIIVTYAFLMSIWANSWQCALTEGGIMNLAIDICQKIGDFCGRQ